MHYFDVISHVTLQNSQDSIFFIFVLNLVFTFHNTLKQFFSYFSFVYFKILKIQFFFIVFVWKMLYWVRLTYTYVYTHIFMLFCFVTCEGIILKEKKNDFFLFSFYFNEFLWWVISIWKDFNLLHYQPWEKIFPKQKICENLVRLKLYWIYKIDFVFCI